MVGSSRLKDKHVLIVGGTAGIGLATAQLAVLEGARVTITGRDSSRLREAEKLLEATSGFCVDAMDREAMKRFIDGLQEIDHVFCTVGSFTDDRQLQAEDDTLRDGMESRFWTAVYLTRDCLPKLSPQGSFVFMSGTGNWKAEGVPVAAASLGAIETFCRGMAVQAKPVRFNTIAPGFTRTDFITGIFGEAADDVIAEVSGKVPVGRVAEPDDIADGVIFLMANSYVNGISLTLDGGYLLQ